MVRESRSSVSTSSSEREYARLAEFGGVLPRRKRLSFPGDLERRRLSRLRSLNEKTKQNELRIFFHGYSFYLLIYLFLSRSCRSRRSRSRSTPRSTPRSAPRSPPRSFDLKNGQKLFDQNSIWNENSRKIIEITYFERFRFSLDLLLTFFSLLRERLRFFSLLRDRLRFRSLDLWRISVYKIKIEQKWGKWANLLWTLLLLWATSAWRFLLFFFLPIFVLFGTFLFTLLLLIPWTRTTPAIRRNLLI